MYSHFLIVVCLIYTSSARRVPSASERLRSKPVAKFWKGQIRAKDTVADPLADFSILRKEISTLLLQLGQLGSFNHALERAPIANQPIVDKRLVRQHPPMILGSSRHRLLKPTNSRYSKLLLQTTSEPTLQDFAVSGGPVIMTVNGSDRPSAEYVPTASEKPVLLYLPGIEFSGYSLHRQIPELSDDFEVRFFAASPDDRTNFSDLVDIVRNSIEVEYTRTGRETYLVGESFGGVLALFVALKKDAMPVGLGGLALINPATSVDRSWPSYLKPLLDALSSLPPGLSDTAYSALATPILAGISGDPLQLGGRFEDDDLAPPLQVATSLRRLAAALPLLTEFPSALPLPTLAFRLSMLRNATEEAKELKLERLTLPVQVFASSQDRVLPSVNEGRRLLRRLPNAGLTVLESSGHVPLLEVRVRLADLLRQARLTQRKPANRKDYVIDFTRPSEEDFAKASERLLPIRKLTSPVFLSTDVNGQRINGLHGLPQMMESRSKKDGIPPVLFVGNHQLFGVLDLPLVVEELHKQTGVLVRALAHPTVFSSNRDISKNITGEGGTMRRDRNTRDGGLVDFEQFGAVPVGPRTLFKLLSRGENTLLYPGGVREAFKSTKRGEMYKLFWPPAADSADFARVAARFGATIVPVAAVGAEEGYEMLLDADEMLNIPYLGKQIANSAKTTPVGRPGERFVSPFALPKIPGRYYFLFGKPFDTSAIDAKDKQACANLYAAVQRELEDDLQYLLERRKDDAWEPAYPRALIEASWNWTRQAPSFRI